MSDNLFEIDISQRKKEDDLITIRFKNEEVHQVNFSKLVSHSKYIRDKYKYSEAVELIDDEFHDIEEKLNINEESIKHFIELIEDEKVTIEISHYTDIYTLSEYFCTPMITNELDKISKAKLFQDINFTLQICQNYEKVTNGFDTKLLIQIENFLRTRINECFSNPKFNELSNSTIYRILSESNCEFDHNLLFEFILESASARFIMFKLVQLDKLNEDNVYKLINFCAMQEETKMYLEYIPFNISFIKNMMNKYDEVLKEKNTINEELKQIKEELKETKIKENETKQELNKTNEELKQTKEELKETKIKEKQTKEELEACKREKKQPKDVINGRKSDYKQYTQSIIVGGNDNYNQLGEKPNNKNKNFEPIISPPVKLSFDPSSLLSYSTYYHHSVLVMSDGSLKGIGDNHDGRISATLQKTIIKDFTDFCIKDMSGRQLAVISAVCYEYGTLYMFSKSSGNERQLVLCDYSINGGDPVFLDIGNHHPVSLFGGYEHSAAIGSEGEVIFINRNSVKNSPKSPIAAVSLPGGEKASSVACCKDSVVVLSSNGRVFTSFVKPNGVLKFSIISELSCHEIICVSGTSSHFLAVSKKGRVFCRGSNGYGQLGLGGGTTSALSFTEIPSLKKYEIKQAYAGNIHSLFETREGKIISCGHNRYGQLLLYQCKDENVYSPTETTITSSSGFCIAGDFLSIVFIGSGPPRNKPNTRIDEYD